AIYGNAAMLDGIIERIEEELGKTPTVVATGGLICEVVPYCKRKIIIDKNLMLWGLGILYKANQKK
ncbi:MAG: pantothenate kinase, partial [Eubacteriales bacterium]|nr:pantothenate kinase [Eubacteriales bacterium]